MSPFAGTRRISWVALLLLSISLPACRKEEPGAKPSAAVWQSEAARFVGTRTCAGCHQDEFRLWTGSDHQLSMQEANENTVLGDFKNSHFDYNGITSFFYRKGGKYHVRTDGPDGTLQDYKIRYTFGVRPLQQYLIEFPGGRYQCLSIAWDSRPSEQGGQRWFHLYPGEKIDYRDVLHWTGPNQNWNHMCAECHSTQLKKNFDPKTRTFRTTWSEINVACEACHGPGSRHMAWAGTSQSERMSAGATKGLEVSLKPSRVDWTVNTATGSAKNIDVASKAISQIETCARCHSRRSELSDNYVWGRPLMNTHLPTLLNQQLYYPDGQILDEDYEYQSFLQSKMFQQGVTCSHCHNPHSLKLLAPAGLICFQCHAQEKFDSPSHHFHRPGSAGAVCVDCHMPIRKYMVVDPRRDHSMRIPRPDLTIKIGVPNACNQCHSDRSSQWAAAQAEKWYGFSKQPLHYGEILYASRNHREGSTQQLRKLAANPSVPDMVRATALSELGRNIDSSVLPILSGTVHDPDPMIRAAVLSAIDPLDGDSRWSVAESLLRDPELAVRVEAASSLVALPRQPLTPEQRASLDRAVDKYVQVQRFNADRPESHVNLGVMYTQLGKFKEAESEYVTAVQIAPYFIPATVNLADLYREQNRDAEGEELLRKALALQPENAEVKYALGMLLSRRGEAKQALSLLDDASRTSDSPHFSFAYAVALNSVNRREAIAAMKAAHQRFPGNREILFGLITFLRDAGEQVAARQYAEMLVRISPGDPSAAGLLRSLQ